MCGIAGIINLQGSPISSVAPLLNMTARMAHRGPDDEGYLLVEPGGILISAYGEDSSLPQNGEASYIPGFPKKHIHSFLTEKFTVALGHRRLSIVDLSPYGHQPMTTPDQRYWITYNGEIYNFQEIAKTLESEGVCFHSSTDTEVILHSYVRWGPACLERFNGMFAFAIWDNKEQILFCARDRIGIKPFYYTIVDGQFIFASDIKTIIASGLYTPEPDPEGLYLAMAFGIAPRPKTAFKDIKALEQAHWMCLHIGSGKIEKHRYWRIPVGTQDHRMSELDATELLEEQLTLAIKYRLVADVPVGTFMSGGIDSTTISAIASKLHPGIKAFTLAYEDNAPELDEVEQARATATMHPMQHIVATVKPENTLKYLHEWVNGYEEPFYHLASNFVISKVVKDNGITVILNGLGGDELFAGYSYYRWACYYDLFKCLSFLGCFMRPLLKLFPDRRSYKIMQLFKVSSLDRLHTALFLKTTDEELHRLFNVAEIKDMDTINYLHQLYIREDIHFEDPVEAFSYMDIMNYIGNHHVHRVDQFTMAHSIEGRFPFLDHHLVEASFNIPSKYKLRGKIQKYILRKIAKKYIAPECLSMKKKGFGLPLKQWMQGPLSGLVRKTLKRLQERDLINGYYIEERLSEYKTGNYNVAHTWHLVMLELWFERFIEGGMATNGVCLCE